MWNFTDPGSDCITIKDSVDPGADGVHGWISDTIIPGQRTIFIYGTYGVPDLSDTSDLGLGDVLADLSIWRTTPPWAEAFQRRYRLHEGFSTWADRAWFLIQGSLITDLPVHIMGHSLGAGAAVILAMRYFLTYPTKTVRCTTFALPGCIAGQRFRRDFAQAFPDHVSYCYGHDIVPRLHLPWLGSPPRLHRAPGKPFEIDLSHPIKTIKEIIHQIINDHLVGSICPTVQLKNGAVAPI